MLIVRTIDNFEDHIGASISQLRRKCASTGWLHVRLSPRGKVISANAEAPICVFYRMPPKKVYSRWQTTPSVCSAKCNQKLLSGSFGVDFPTSFGSSVWPFPERNFLGTTFRHMRAMQAWPTRDLPKEEALMSEIRITEYVRLRPARHQVPVRTAVGYRP